MYTQEYRMLVSYNRTAPQSYLSPLCYIFTALTLGTVEDLVAKNKKID